MKNTPLIFAALFSILGCCKKEEKTIINTVVNNAEMAIELKSSSDSIKIGTNYCVLSSYLWRDFMPIAEENGSKLMCVSKLKNRDSSSIVQSIQLKKQYVINGNDIWISEYSDVKKYDLFIEGYSNGGPKWGPNITVDVVCEFENAGITYRVIAKSQYINRTD